MISEKYLILGVAFPFIMNAVGSLLIYLTPAKGNWEWLSGVSAGIMTAACIWSLIIPAVKLSAHLEGLAFLPACVGMLIGAIVLYFSDQLIKKRKAGSSFNKLFWAMALHNLPEGLAVGFAFGSTSINVGEAMGIAFGIGVQNLPEGLAVSLAYKTAGSNKSKSCLYGVLSGVCEPIGALIGFITVIYLQFLQPWILAFSAGAMVYVIVEELIPESVKSKFGIFGFAVGFLFMMGLDLFLG